MRIAHWDTADPEFYFDNPNLRWGDPAYQVGLWSQLASVTVPA